MADSQRKTANLFSSSFTDGYSLNANGLPQTFEGRIATLVPIAINAENCTLSYRTSKNTNFIFAVISNGTLVRRVAGKSNGDTIDTSGGDTLYICIYESLGQGIEASEVSEIMLNEGETALPYEPYSSTGWVHSLRKLTTATEAVENPLYSDGTAITSYTIKGNTVQNGTPSPSNPVDVNGVGVRTENLLDILSPEQSRWSATKTAYGVYYVADFVGVTAANRYRLPTVAGKTYTISGSIDNNAITVQLSNYLDDTTYPVEGDIRLQGNFSRTFTAQGQTTLSIFAREANQSATITDMIVYEGTTTIPYEDYGFKIPISNGQQTTNIYLGSTQTVRAIKKLVLTGQENITSTHLDIGLFNLETVTDYNRDSAITCICTHLEARQNVTAFNSVQPNQCAFYITGSSINIFYMRNTAYSTIEDFKQWLAAQYANGTPVTVWYVLAEPETATVNEPLMKIGDYADTLSNATAIPTTEGANSITVDTTVQPSEFTATWTGWHDASVKEKSENYLDENDFGLVEVAAGTYRVGTDVGVLPSGKYTFNAVKSSSAVQIYHTTKNGSTYNYETITNLPYTFTADGVSNQIFRSAGNTGSSWADLGYTNVMLNTGETAQTYEPYWK